MERQSSTTEDRRKPHTEWHCVCVCVAVEIERKVNFDSKNFPLNKSSQLTHKPSVSQPAPSTPTPNSPGPLIIAHFPFDSIAPGSRRTWAYVLRRRKDSQTVRVCAKDAAANYHKCVWRSWKLFMQTSPHSGEAWVASYIDGVNWDENVTDGKRRRTEKAPPKILSLTSERLRPRRTVATVSGRKCAMLPMRNWVKHQFAHPTNVHKLHWTGCDVDDAMIVIWVLKWHSALTLHGASPNPAAATQNWANRKEILHILRMFRVGWIWINVWMKSEASAYTYPDEYLCFAAL